MSIPDAVRAQALADLHAGEQPAVVAARYGLDAGKVRVWKSRHVAPHVTPAVAGEAPRRPAQEARQEAIGQLVTDLLRAKLEAAVAVAERLGDAEWLAAQSAADLVAIGAWLDGGILSLGDRLAGQAREPPPPAPDGPPFTLLS